MSENQVAVAEKPEKQLPSVFKEMQIVNGLPQLPNMEAVYEYSRLAHAAGIFVDVKSAAQGAMKIVYGLSLGMTAPEALNDVYFAQGRAGLYSQAVARKIKSSGKYDYKVIFSDKKICRLEVYVEGEAVGVEEFTVEQVNDMKLQDKPAYKADMALMLFYKCISRVYKKWCGDVYNIAINTVEDLQDGETIRIVEEAERGGKAPKFKEKVDEKANKKAKDRVEAETVVADSEAHDAEEIEEIPEQCEPPKPNLEEKLEAIQEVATENGMTEQAEAAAKSLEKVKEKPKRDLAKLTLTGAKHKWTPTLIQAHIAATYGGTLGEDLNDEQWSALQAHLKSTPPAK